MNLVRKIKISKITNIELSDEEKRIINYIEYRLINLSQRHENNIIYFVDFNGIHLFDYNILDESFHVRHSNIWLTISNRFSIKYEYIKPLMAYLIEMKFKNELSQKNKNK